MRTYEEAQVKQMEDYMRARQLCRWTMKNTPEAEKCRFVGWIDEYGNRNVALEDTACKEPHRKRWVIQPVGQMHFNGYKRPSEHNYTFTHALKTVPGSDKIEDHFVTPETLTAKEIPSTFEAMWSIAKPIENCEENVHLIGHYEQHKGA